MDQLLCLSREFRALSAKLAEDEKERTNQLFETWKLERKRVFDSATHFSTAIQQLRSLNSMLKFESVSNSRLEELKIEILRLIDSFPAPVDWHIRYCMEIDPENSTEIITFGLIFFTLFCLLLFVFVYYFILFIFSN
jgi:predicted RNA-binding protein with EMAP domain